MTAYAIASAAFLSGLFIGIFIGVSMLASAIWLLSEQIDDEPVDYMEEA